MPLCKRNSYQAGSGCRILTTFPFGSDGLPVAGRTLPPPTPPHPLRGREERRRGSPPDGHLCRFRGTLRADYLTTFRSSSEAFPHYGSRAFHSSIRYYDRDLLQRWLPPQALRTLAATAVHPYMPWRPFPPAQKGGDRPSAGPLRSRASAPSIFGTCSLGR